MPRARILAVSLVATALGLFAASPARAGSWQNQFSGFNAALKGDLYTPTTPAASPAVLVAIHMCTGTSNVVHGWFDSYADQQGFYIIAPDAGKQCFDSSASRNGDKAAIVTMVNYLINNKNADKNRIFAAGMSSGGCMTNTLLAIYPDVFAGGSAMPGFPAGGWPSGDITCTKCGSNPPSTDGKYWGDMARAVFSWSGKYPCSQQWVGGGDQYKFNAWLPAVAAQFQNLSNLGAGMPATGRSGWTRTVYKDSAGNIRLETNLGPTSQMHDLETVNPKLYGDVITFLGLDKATGACGLDSGGTGGTGGGAGGSGGATGAGGRGGGGGTAGGAGGSNGGRGGNGSGGSGGSGGLTGAGGRGGMNAGSGGTTAGGGGSGPGGSTPGTGGTTSGSGGSTQGAGGATSGSGGSGATGSAGSGTTGTGGSTTGTGGSVEPAGSGGASVTGSGGTSPSGSGGTGPGDNGASGCACAVTGGSQGAGLAMLLVAALGLVVRRRPRRR